jgi:hypothetical protein
MRRYIGLAFAAGFLASAGVHADDKVAEASMLVTGQVELNTDGTVRSYALDKQDKLPAPVVDLVKRNVESWKFQFAATPESVVTETMSLRIVAKNTDGKHMALAVTGVQFEDGSAYDDYVHSVDRPQPSYPSYSLHNKISGRVYLLAKVGRDGKVADVAAEQVNLRQSYAQTNMALFRKDLTDAAVKAIRHWTFSTPTKGKWVDSPYWLVRIPVDFHIRNENLDVNDGEQYGSWEIYMPGPRMDVPWLRDKRLIADAADTTPDGTTHQLSASPQLASP